MIETRLRQADMFIGGEWVAAKSGRQFVVRNPATLEPFAEIADGGREETRAAIEAAYAAFPEWSQATAEQRAELLLKAAELIMRRREELAVVVTSENGKTLADARAEVQGAAANFVWNAEEARRIYGRIVPPSVRGTRHLVLRQPVGVVGAIVPWNFPASMITRKIGPALAAGCTVVVRPARATPVVAVELFKIFEEVGFPKGVVNLVTGTDSAGMGEELATNPKVRKITFTGSTAVGKLLIAQAASTVKHVSMELGGHAPFIVFEDADLDAAATSLVGSRFRNCGQVCVSANRALVQRSIVEEFTAKVAAKAKAMRVGNGLEPGVDLGPLIDKRGFDRVVEHVADAVAKGATVVAGGKRADVGALKGYFHEPTVLADATLDMRIMREETFGPALPILAFDTEEEAIRIANDTEYGLASYFFARDIGRIFRVAEKLEYGMVNVNGRGGGVNVPFGGMKESGLGRENGSEGIEAFLETKSVSIGL